MRLNAASAWRTYTHACMQGVLLSPAEIKDITADVLNPKPPAPEPAKGTQRVRLACIGSRQL